MSWGQLIWYTGHLMDLTESRHGVQNFLYALMIAMSLVTSVPAASRFQSHCAALPTDYEGLFIQESLFPIWISPTFETLSFSCSDQVT